jgi:hypothetical protein
MGSGEKSSKKWVRQIPLIFIYREFTTIVLDSSFMVFLNTTNKTFNFYGL